MYNYKIVTTIQEKDYELLLELIHSSFEEYEEKGLHFTCSKYDVLDLKNKVLKDAYFIAVDESCNFLGITSVSIKNGKKCVWAYENITAISPVCKGRGIGSALYRARTEYLKKKCCSYLLSDTAIDAVGSVLWHLKKCNCKKYGYQSFTNTNYYSYVFREDLKKISILREFVYKIRFYLALIKTKVLKRKDGSKRWVF